MNKRDILKHVNIGGIIITEVSDDNLALSELEEKVFAIDQKKKAVLDWGLSKEVEALVIKELNIQRNVLKEIMHNKIDSL